MTFATALDLESRIGAAELLMIADRDNSGAVDAAVIDAALQDADAEIVSLLAGAGSLDAGDPPRELIRLACDIATYRLYRSNPTEDVRARYKDAVEKLRLVAQGRASLDGGATAPTATAAPSKAAASSPGTRIFKRGLS